MALLSREEVQAALAALEGWTLADHALTKSFTFASFPDAVAFLVRLAFEAQAADHHPDVAIIYRRVTLTYTTHSEGGLTRKDIDGAETADRLVAVKAP